MCVLFFLFISLDDEHFSNVGCNNLIFRQARREGRKTHYIIQGTYNVIPINLLLPGKKEEKENEFRHFRLQST